MTPWRRCILLIEEFRKLNPEMPMQTAMTFVLIAEAGERGIEHRHLADRLGVAKASVSRNCALLGDYDARGRPGYELVYSVENPENRRAKIAYLTPKGRRLANTLFHLFSD